MLLRRITEHVKAQNWFAVAIDFVIVVVGVFIGIQVSNWNEACSDRLSEREIVDAIADDIRRERKELDLGRESALMGIRAANGAFIFQSPVPPGALHDRAGLIPFQASVRAFA